MKPPPVGSTLTGADQLVPSYVTTRPWSSTATQLAALGHAMAVNADPASTTSAGGAQAGTPVTVSVNGQLGPSPGYCGAVFTPH